MLKIFHKIKLVFAAILAIAILYAGLTIVDLQSHAQAQNRESRSALDQSAQIQSQLASLSQEISSLKTQNENLQNKVNTLKNNKTIQVVEKPVVQTKTVTQTQIQEIEKNQATVTVQNVGSFKVDLQADDTAFSITKKAAEQNGFDFQYTMYSFGAFITSIGGTTPTGNQFWAFYFNGNFSNVGASDQPVKKGDSVFWQLATF